MAGGKVFALLVGIDEYGGNPASLTGCKNDVAALGTVLEGRVGEGAFIVQTLLDRDATRQNIIEAFTSHLGQAGEGDVALFAFSGHGSVEPVEERFWFLEPTKQNQTIVCADSRRKKAGDLADKELSELIRAVSVNGPHVVVVLDCCHAGGGTRAPDVRVRQAPANGTSRPLSAYLPALQATLRQAEAEVAAGNTEAGLSYPRHIALFACQSTELSKEVTIDGSSRGAFSAGLERALTTLPPTASYRDLVGAAANDVRNRVGDQQPYVFTEDEDIDRSFLGGALQQRSGDITVEAEHGVWFVDVGSVHGVPGVSDDDPTLLSAHIIGAAPPEGDHVTVRIIERFATRSTVVAVDGSLVAGRRYSATVVSVPVPPAQVVLRGAPPSALALLEHALEHSPSARIAPATGATADLVFHVVADADRLTLTRPDGSPLTTSIAADEVGAVKVAERVEHVVRWHLIKDLDNPTSQLAGAVTLELREAAKGETPDAAGSRPPLTADSTGVIRRHYQRDGAGWTNPYVFVSVHNDSDRDLYCTVLDLTDRFRCHSKLLPVTLVVAGSSAVALDGRPIDLQIPAERLASGGSDVRDWLKVIACEARFETDGFFLPVLDDVLDSVTRSARPRNVLERLGRRITREAEDEIFDAAAPQDWTTTMVCVVTDRPRS